MMEGTYYKEWSAALGREMEFKSYGSAGVPVLAFPCRGGRFYDWENNAMPDAAARLLREGRIRLFCADSIDSDSLTAESLTPRRRAEMQEKYFNYITAELAPRILALSAAEGGEEHAALWCVGADAGAYQAVNCRLRRPELFCGAIGLSGLYDPAGWLGGPDDDLALRNSPLAALSVSLPTVADKAALKKGCFLLCAGQGGYEAEALASTRALDLALKAAGIPVQTEIWGQDVAHDWYWWGREWGIFAERCFG